MFADALRLLSTLGNINFMLTHEMPLSIEY